MRGWLSSQGIFAGGADGGYVKDITSLNLYSQFIAFRIALTAPNNLHFDLAHLRQTVHNIFGRNATSLVADASLQTDNERVFDTILAIFIAPIANRGPLAALTEVAKLVDLLERIAEGDTKLLISQANR